MSHPESKQLTRAEELFDVGKLDEALQLLDDLIQLEGVNLQQKSYFQFLKGQILCYQNKTEETIRLGEEMFKEGQKLNENLHSFDGLYFLVMGLALEFKFGKAFRLIKKAEAILRQLSDISKDILIQREARLNLLKAYMYIFSLSHIDLAEKCLEWTLSLQKELTNTFEIVWANILMANIMIRIKGKFDLGIEYTKKALSLAKNIKFNHFWIAYCQIAFGVIYLSIGEFNLSLKHSKKSLAIYREINNAWYIGNNLSNMGLDYTYVGDYDNALKCLEESLLYFENQPILGEEFALNNLIEVALEKDSIELAQDYFHRLENLYNQKKSASVVLLYQLSKALMLKRSSRIRDKAKVEELLKEVVETKTVWFTWIITALIHLCDLLLAEFRINNNSEVFDELNHYISKLLTVAETQHSYLVFCETFILQAKLALLSFDVKAAQRFLTQAQKIAETYGIKRLAMKISYEHDELLKQEKIWENLKESEASLSERWELAGLTKQMESMVRKRMIEVPELSDEDSVFLLIVSEGGTPLFSHSFVKEKSIESQIFGGFITTIDYFIREIFSEGLDRATFGEYTLLMKPIPPFFISYIFKGHSYNALQRIDYFIDHIKKKDAIWQNVLKSFQVNQAIHLKDIPVLESLITETFITKSVVFS